MQIEKGKELRLENLLSLRKKLTQEEVNIELDKISKFLDEKGIKKNGSLVTATFGIESQSGHPTLDIELLLPMDKKVELPPEYKLKEVFHLVNAVYARHTGNPNLLQNTYNEMLSYIQENKLQQLTVGYNVQVNELIHVQSIDQLAIDVYIGVSPNIL
jgi:effector-binding domain-containing protein